MIKTNKGRCLIFGCLLMAGLIATPFARGGQTFVNNAGFEVNTWGNGFANDWWFYPPGTAVYHNPEPNKAHSGQAFITITAGPDGWANSGPSLVPVAHDTNYTIASFVADSVGGQSGQNPAGAAALAVQWYANRGDTYESRLDDDSIALTVPKDGNYYYFSGQVRNDSNANYALVILAASRVNGQSPVFNFDDVTFTRASPLARPDFNGDRKVNFVDFAQLAQGYGKSIAAYDMDGDGSFGISDLGLFATDWTRTIPELAGYQFVWSDEFDGVEIDRTNWTHEISNSLRNNELESYTDRPDNSIVENGNLVIIAREEQYGSNNYTSALLYSQTKADFRYGRMAARIKLPVGQGIWPAFWMLPSYQLYGGWPNSGEIDIMEAINQMDRIYGTMHFSDAQHQRASSGGSYYLGGASLADDFHVYAVEWEHDEIRWFVDDVMFFSETEWSSGGNPYPAPFDEHFHLLLNVAIGGDWAGPPDQTTVFPQRMLVDWVRVYQKTP